MHRKVLEFIKREELMRAGELVVAGVSGGADSICLLSVLYELKDMLGIRLAVVHVHHGIRGEEADRDAEFVRGFCEERGIPCRIFRRDVPAIAQEKRLSEEEAGRMVRYSCFKEALEEWGGALVAVAHNRNDNAETVLFHLFRGSGIRGLSGMAAKAPLPEAVGRKGGDGSGALLVRPLLFASRKEIEGYLKEKNLPFCEDSTNASEAYTRNRIRRNILPQAELVNEEAILHVVQAAEMAGELAGWLDRASEGWIGEHCKETEDGNFLIPAGNLKAIDPVLAGAVIRKLFERLRGSLKNITRRHTDSVLSLAEKQSGREIRLPGGITAKIEYGVIRLGKKAGGERDGADKGKSSGEILIPEEQEKDAELFGYRFLYRCFERKNGEKIPENRYTKWFDYDKIKNRLCLRGRRPGDYFQAFSDGGSQTIKAYMINEKIPSGKREEIPLLADGCHILWIVGGRISEAYKITAGTKRILAVTVNRD